MCLYRQEGRDFVFYCNRTGLALDSSTISSPKAEAVHAGAAVNVAQDLLTPVSVGWEARDYLRVWARFVAPLNSS